MVEGPELPAGDGMECCSDSVPLDSLSQPDENEAMTAPEVGDKVTYTKEGTVSRIVGNQAFVNVTHVNGQELPAAAEPEPGEGTDTMEGLEGQANQLDQQGAY